MFELSLPHWPLEVKPTKLCLGTSEVSNSKSLSEDSESSQENEVPMTANISVKNKERGFPSAEGGYFLRVFHHGW